MTIPPLRIDAYVIFIRDSYTPLKITVLSAQHRFKHQSILNIDRKIKTYDTVAVLCVFSAKGVVFEAALLGKVGN